MTPNFVPRLPLFTRRLVLHPSDSSYAKRGFEIQSDWDVARMLRMASYPPSEGAMVTWFENHESEWWTGKAYRFVIVYDDLMVGLVDVDEITEGSGELGYWLDSAYWGNGFAYEAAVAIVDFSRSISGLQVLLSSHAADNPASGTVLVKLGFIRTTLSMKYSNPRAAAVLHQNYQRRI